MYIHGVNYELLLILTNPMQVTNQRYQQQCYVFVTVVNYSNQTKSRAWNKDNPKILYIKRKLSSVNLDNELKFCGNCFK